MIYRQTNPLPIPPCGPSERVVGPQATTFDWEYALAKENLLALYDKGKALAWNASDLDWDQDVDLERVMRHRTGESARRLRDEVLRPPRPLDEATTLEMNLNMNAWMLSQFLHGEQGALLATAKIVQSAPLEEAKWYAANQVADEARHVEVYHRYLTEKLGRSFAVNPHLQVLLDDILRDSRWDMTYLGMQIMVEGLALAAFGFMKIQMAGEPLIQDITTRVMADESRHVAFGVLSLQDLFTEMTSSELAEREEFLLEATHLMHDRLLMEQVYERMELDVPVWTEWARNSPFMRAFRQMLFSKIVPNLKRLGLLTPRVRREYERLGLLHFESADDSVTDPNPIAPAELMELLARLREGSDGGRA